MSLWNGILVPATIIFCLAKKSCRVYTILTGNPLEFPLQEVSNLVQIRGHAVKCVAYLIGTLAILGAIFPRAAVLLHRNLGLEGQPLIPLTVNQSRISLLNISSDAFHFMSNSYLDFSEYATLMQTSKAFNIAGKASLARWKANSIVSNKQIAQYQMYLERNLNLVDLKNVNFISKLFNGLGKIEYFNSNPSEIIKNKLHYALMNVKNYKIMNKFTHHNYFSQYVKNLITLEIEDNLNNQSETINLLAKNSPNLKSLKLYAYFILHGHDIISFAESCPELNQLLISCWYPSIDKFIAISKFKALKHLTFEFGNFHLTQQFLNQMNTSDFKFVNLEILIIDFSRSKTHPITINNHLHPSEYNPYTSPRLYYENFYLFLSSFIMRCVSLRTIQFKGNQQLIKTIMEKVSLYSERNNPRLLNLLDFKA